jgi:hypothetical protein
MHPNKSSEIMQIPNPPKGKLIGFLITIEWIEEGKTKHVVLHMRKHKGEHYKARITHLTRDEKNDN